MHPENRVLLRDAFYLCGLLPEVQAEVFVLQLVEGVELLLGLGNHAHNLVSLIIHLSGADGC